ncbi:aldehyde dehydrogenase family protein [bacterium]|jgi:glyceraldehyde-3-phosphate dehydrogenase (NADP+)|nr:aldehyde dehydrogenase family protein [bacterium]
MTPKEILWANADTLEQATQAAFEAFQTYKHSSHFIRAELLAAMAVGISQRRHELVQRMITEAGKPHLLANGEIDRAIQTFKLSAIETLRWGGHTLPVDIDPNGRSYGEALVRWVPRGPVLAISPFNFPLNLGVHKVAPALAVGATVLLKPPPQAAGCAFILHEIYEDAIGQIRDRELGETIPKAAFQVLQASPEVIGKAVEDPRFGVLSFTGSDKVGWQLQAKATRKKVILELGGNAAVIVHRDADLQRAAARCAYGAYAYAGQVCISVQRILVDQQVMKEFSAQLIGEIKKLKVGDPADPATLVGPMIDSNAANRVMSWVDEAVHAGAKMIQGGERQGNLVHPILLTHVPLNEKVVTEEVFGPVAVLQSYDKMGEAIQEVNRSRFGLQAGVFSNDHTLIQKVIRQLDVGGIIINDVPTYRADVAPYGGMKESGIGREGPRSAMEAYCEPQTILTSTSRELL